MTIGIEYQPLCKELPAASLHRQPGKITRSVASVHAGAQHMCADLLGRDIEATPLPADEIKRQRQRSAKMVGK